MHNKITGKISLTSLLICMLIFSAGVTAGDYNQLNVFGDSLSDPGSLFAPKGRRSCTASVSDRSLLSARRKC